jgi:hypothetical protein
MAMSTNIFVFSGLDCVHRVAIFRTCTMHDYGLWSSRALFWTLEGSQRETEHRKPLYQIGDDYHISSKNENRASLPKYLISKSDCMIILHFLFH